jgi:hypothetical protein
MVALNDPYLKRLAEIESTSNPMARNKNSSAKGLFQFIDSTAKDYGITAPFGTPEYTAQETAAAKKFTDDNRRVLSQALKREPSAGELYLAHQQGAGGALKLLQNPNALAVELLGEKAVKLNRGDESMKAKDFVNQWVNKFEGGQGQEVMRGGQGQDSVGETFNLELPDGTVLEGIPAGTTKDQIRAKLQAGGYDITLLEQPQAEAVSEQPQQVQEKSGLGGLALPAYEGLTFGQGSKAIGALGGLLAKGYLEGQDFLSGENYAPTLGSLMKEGITSQRADLQKVRQDRPVLSTIAEVGGAIPTAIGLAGTAPARALGSLAGRAGLAGRVGAGAMAGEASQRVYEAGQADIGKEGEILGRKGVSLGGILGGSIPLVGAGAGALKKAITPQIKETAQRTVDLAKKYNIPLGLDDLTDSNFYKYMVSEGQNLPFSGGGSKAETQLKAFTKAVAKSIGLEDADRLTPANMNKAFDTVGKKFDDLTKGKSFSMTDDALDNLSGIEEAVNGGTYGQDGIRLFKIYTDDLFSRLKNDVLDGDSLAKLRNKFARISRSGTNPDAKGLAKDFENVLIDMIGENAPDALKTAKYQYKNLIAVEPLAQKVQVDGFISPSLLSNRVAGVYKRQFTKGKAGELGDLAEIGQAIKQSLPQSGTAPRQAVRDMGLGLGAIGGGFINPAIPAAYFGGKGTQILGNRLLQNRNVNQDLLQELLTKKLPAISGQSPLRLGTISGATTGALQQ